MSAAGELFVRGERDPDLLRLSTAGSVDDGKSTLIGRLLLDAKALYDDQIEALGKLAGSGDGEPDLALITDGLKAEREQSITIDVAYRHFSTRRRRYLIADTPGHVQYTRNMATGASTADVAVILIDASRGVLTQSKRHGFIAALLGVPHIVVAVNKMDLVGFDRSVFERIRRDYSEFAARLDLPDLAFVPISALRGDNVIRCAKSMPWYRGVPLLTHLDAVYVGADRNLVDLRFPVQRVVRPDQTFRGYSGTVSSGVLRAGEEIVALPSGKRSRISRIVTHDGELRYAPASLAVTLCLEDEIDIARGDMLARPNNVPRLERSLEAMVVWMHETAMCPGKSYVVKHTTNTVKASCAEILYRVDPGTLHRERSESLALNDIGRVRITLFRPLYVDAYRRNRATGSFILIDPITNNTVGGGMVIDRERADFFGANPDKTASSHISWHAGKVGAIDRATLLRQEPATLWLTGLSGAGKSTLAFELERKLLAIGHAAYVLDGDNVRHGLNRDLGFAPEDRKENIRRIAEVTRLLNDAGLFVITAFISPYKEDREAARNIIGADRFKEIYLSTPIEVCEQRDPKGLYDKARSGEISEFTGVSAPYEAPDSPALVLDTAVLSAELCIERILTLISGRFKGKA